MELSPAMRAGLLFCFSIALAEPFLAVQWSSRQYGPDGPWNAVTTGVGGLQNDTPIASQYTIIDLYPASYRYYSSFVPSPIICQQYQDSDCGLGGIWDTSAATEIQFEPSLYDVGEGLQGLEFQQALTLFSSSGEYPVYNASVTGLTNGSITYPNGIVSGPQVGLFSLDSGFSNDQEQKFTLSSDNTSAGALVAWIYSGFLYNSSFVSSYSYGLHYGSATLNYPGSLYFGGYDKGRVIGPYTTFSTSFPTLLDITIGVETGRSPFDFQSRGGYLIANGKGPGPIQVNPDAVTPYLYLPAETCEALAGALPVYYDPVTRYYLWNTSDANYNPVTTSPAYLGFVFPPAPGALSNVTIKIPFRLLDLTLSAPLVNNSLQYFPCQPLTLRPDVSEYRLGRAFLQGAFMGRNSNQFVTWLAQAPGPGQSNEGLGMQGVSIGDGDTDIDVFVGDDLFRQTWDGHWTPLPYGIHNSGPSGNLSAGAIAGIVVGAVAVVVMIIGFIILRSRKKRKNTEAAGSEVPEVESTSMAKSKSGSRGYESSYLQNPASRTTAFDPTNGIPQELATSFPR